MSKQPLTPTELKLLIFIQTEKRSQEIADRFIYEVKTVIVLLHRLKNKGFIKSRRSIFREGGRLRNGKIYSASDEGIRVLKEVYRIHD